ncbi:acyltransferase [Clostridium sp. P21]|uniref:Acyltransferase n=2 Tax=Clostridium muellerianum TaxID=2716538 RepID=A0A7Y0HNT4_9CLOT|nr:acyltransferase [Clostridium muellerianum]NMM61968.1 acyltransferase [Clostridium muellerianum]
MLYKNWNRVLPTNELFFDRWKKAEYVNCGENTSIYDSSVIMGNVCIGKNVWIGPFTLLEGINGKLTIGDNCDISAGVHIYTHDSSLNVISGGKVPLKKGNVYIGNNTYIGSMSVIKEDVSIGNSCIIGANSFVNKDIPDNCVAVGTPAKIIGKVIVNGENTKIEYFTK